MTPTPTSPLQLRAIELVRARDAWNDGQNDAATLQAEFPQYLRQVVYNALYRAQSQKWYGAL